jgi:hypothetical protein
MLERRGAKRVDKVFRVLLSTEEIGDLWCVARNISATGMFVEMAEPFPLNTKVIVRFKNPSEDGEICAIARVQNHYYFHYAEAGEIRALSGVGLRFLRFLPEAGQRARHGTLH